jgi:hypothetical protein
MTEWPEIWGMSFNVEKCTVMHMGPRKTWHEYSKGGIILKTNKEDRDIGVTMNSSLQAGMQCRKAAMIASVVLGQVSRVFHYRDRYAFVNLYNSK